MTETSASKSKSFKILALSDGRLDFDLQTAHRGLIGKGMVASDDGLAGNQSKPTSIEQLADTPYSAVQIRDGIANDNELRGLLQCYHKG